MQLFTSIIFPTITSIVAGVLLWRYHTKPKLFFHCSNIGYAMLFPPDEKANAQPFAHLTHSITISNAGQIPLKKCEIYHAVDVSHNREKKTGNPSFIAIGVLPDIPYKFEDDGKIIVFESLAPRETVTIIYIYPLTASFNAIHRFSSFGHVMVRSEQALGEPANFVRSINFPKWLGTILWFLIFIGFWTLTTFVGNLITLVDIYAKYNNAFKCLT